MRIPNNEIIKKLDSEIKTLEDFSNDDRARNLIDDWLDKNPDCNDCRNALQSEEFLNMIKFKYVELKIKLKCKDKIKVLGEKIYDQIIEPQDKKLDLQNSILVNEKESEKKEEIDTSVKNIIINNNQSGDNHLIPPAEVSKGNQI